MVTFVTVPMEVPRAFSVTSVFISTEIQVLANLWGE